MPLVVLGGGMRACERRKAEAVLAEGTENWRLILEAARALTLAGQAPLTRQTVYQWIWKRHSRDDHDRPSRGRYVLADTVPSGK